MQTYHDLFNELNDYILDEKNMQKSLQMRIVNNNNNIEIKKNNIETPKNNNAETKIISNAKNDFFIPNQQDTLFWCFFIIKNGDIAYEILNNKNSLVSKQMKIDLVSTIRQNKEIVKIYKFDTISNIESNLANDNNLNIKTFLTLCAIHNINIIFVSKKTYFELLMNDSNSIYIIRELSSNSNYYYKYGFEKTNIENDILTKIKDSLYKIDKIDKPIKSITYYKVEDLVNICNKLAIETSNKETGKQKSKKDLYELIIQYF
jgi:hypothetical protein